MLSQIDLHLYNCDGLKHAISGVELMHFPGGEPHVKGLWSLHSTDIDGFLITAKISDFNGIGMVAMLKDYLDRVNPQADIILYIPYLPGARQDRGEPLGCKVYADMINAMKFDYVVCVDPHSDVMPALLERCLRIELHEVFDISYIRRASQYSPVFVAPDAGAVKKVEALSTKLHTDIRYGRKHRDIQTGELTGFSCDPIPHGSDAIIVDDICDGGGTFIGLAKVMNHPPEYTHLWTTHGIYSKGLKELSKHFATISCTDSFPVSHNGTYSDKADRKADNLRKPILHLVVDTLIERGIL